jgi:hypothetical protein
MALFQLQTTTSEVVGGRLLMALLTLRVPNCQARVKISQNTTKCDSLHGQQRVPAQLHIDHVSATLLGSLEAWHSWRICREVDKKAPADFQVPSRLLPDQALMN